MHVTGEATPMPDDMVSDTVSEFLRAATAPLRWHASGTLAEAETLRAADPALAARSIHAAASLGDADAVRRLLAQDGARATAAGGPYGWDPLTYLCFSRYLRLDPARGDGFVDAARALLDAGASAATGYHDPSHAPAPAFESALYGAAGVAHHAGLTRLLLERGADPNDDEVPYHTPETYDNAALEALLASGRLSADSLAMMLLRKHDWHDYEGVKLLLAHGADPNRPTRWRGKTAFHQALLRDNRLSIIELALDHGADPAVEWEEGSGFAEAARGGRGDVLALLERRGAAIPLRGADRLIAACARGDGPAVHALLRAEPDLADRVRAGAPTLLARFAGAGNADGLRLLLDLGVPADTRLPEDGYWGQAANGTALHVAAWRARHGAVRLLLDRGAPVDARDAEGRSPLALAVKACVDSYWTDRRAPDSVRALLAAGASTEGARFPCGYDDVDALLAAHGAQPTP